MSQTVQTLRLTHQADNGQPANGEAGTLSRAVSLHLAGKREEALELLQRAAGAQASAEVWRAMGHIEFELGRFEAAA